MADKKRIIPIREGDKAETVADNLKANFEYLVDEVNKMGNPNVPSQKLLLEVTPKLIYSEEVYTHESTQVTATATLLNAEGIISLQFQNSMLNWNSGTPVSTFSKSGVVNGKVGVAEIITASVDTEAGHLEARAEVTGVRPIYYGNAFYADELTYVNVATPRLSPKGTYTATIQKDYSFCMLIPKEMGELDLSKITWNGFLFPMESAGLYGDFYKYESGTFNEETIVNIKIE